jgi:hypothetical protein
MTHRVVNLPEVLAATSTHTRFSQPSVNSPHARRLEPH